MGRKVKRGIVKLGIGILKGRTLLSPALSSHIKHGRRGSTRGFTLIELLIVIVIISIISSVAVISIRFNQNKNLETFSHQLANLFNLAEEEAMLRPATLGFALLKNNYQFYEYNENKKTWLPLSDPRLGLHSIPGNTQIILKVHDKTIEANGKPEIIISPSGDISPFILLIGKTDNEAQYQVSAKANGEIQSAPLPQE